MDDEFALLDAALENASKTYGATLRRNLADEELEHLQGSKGRGECF